MKCQLLFGVAIAAAASMIAGGNLQAQPHSELHHGRPTVQSGSRYVVPGSDRSRSGSYYLKNGTYYYNPGSYSSGRFEQVVPQKVAYGSFSHVDDLAVRLESLTNDLCLELYYNYSNNRGFDDTYREAYHMLEIAKYIHKEEHHGHRDEIAKELGGLDSLMHHVEEDIANWRSNRGHHYHHNHGHVSKKDQLMQSIESVVHHLMHDVGVKSRNAPVPGGQAPAPGGAPPAPRGRVR